MAGLCLTRVTKWVTTVCDCESRCWTFVDLLQTWPTRQQALRLDLIRQRSPVVSVLVSFPSVPDRLQQFAHRGGERHGRGDAPGGLPCDDLLSGLGAQTFALHHPRMVASRGRHNQWSSL